MHMPRLGIVFVGLTLVLAMVPTAQAKHDPLILAAWPDGDLLVIEGTDLALDESTEPSVTLGEQLLSVASFTTTEIQAEMPDPPPGVGTFLLTVESKANRIGVFWVALGAPVPKTGQTHDGSVGEDGDLQKGVGWPEPRFTDNLDGTVTDNLTGLVWLQFANCWSFEYECEGRLRWDDALPAANALEDGRDCNGDGNSDLNDSSEPGDWRVPNVQEMQSLIDYGKIEIMIPTGYMDPPGQPFILDQALLGCPDYCQLSEFLSSTTHEGDKTTTYWVSLGNGAVGIAGKDPRDPEDPCRSTYYVWPVRGGQ